MHISEKTIKEDNKDESMFAGIVNNHYMETHSLIAIKAPFSSSARLARVLSSSNLTATFK